MNSKCNLGIPLLLFRRLRSTILNTNMNLNVSSLYKLKFLTTRSLCIVVNVKSNIYTGWTIYNKFPNAAELKRCVHRVLFRFSDCLMEIIVERCTVEERVKIIQTFDQGNSSTGDDFKQVTLTISSDLIDRPI